MSAVKVKACSRERYEAFHIALAHLNIRRVKAGKYQAFGDIVKKLRNLCGPAEEFELRTIMGENLPALNPRHEKRCGYCRRDILKEIKQIVDSHLRTLPGLDLKLFKTKGLDCLTTVHPSSKGSSNWLRRKQYM